MRSSRHSRHVRTASTGRRPAAVAAGGFVAGTLAYLLGFATIYLRTTGSVPEDVVGAITDLGEVSAGVDPPATWQVVGWLYYAAHNVDVVVEVAGLGRSGTGALPLTEGVLWERWFVLLPVVTLVIAGVVVARFASAADPRSGALAGGAVALGYAPLAVAGILLTAWDASIQYGGLSASGSIGVDPLTGVVVAGVAYPLCLGAAGGAAVGAIADG